MKIFFLAVASVFYSKLKRSNVLKDDLKFSERLSNYLIINPDTFKSLYGQFEVGSYSFNHSLIQSFSHSIINTHDHPLAFRFRLSKLYPLISKPTKYTLPQMVSLKIRSSLPSKYIGLMNCFQ